MARGYNPRLERAPLPSLVVTVPIASVMIASLLPTLLPMVATLPLLPPAGLLVFLAWRLLVRDVWPSWMGLPLGLFDDLISGYPLGTSAFVWTIMLFLMDFIDRRYMWRDYRQDWRIGALLLALALALGLFFANLVGGRTSLLYLIPQIIITGLCLPLTLRYCAVLDRFRWRI